MASSPSPPALKWGVTYVYDATSHALIGAHFFNDVETGTCHLFSYDAGVAAACSEGTICSLCDAPETACAPACSIEALEKEQGRLITFDDEVKIRDYDDQTPISKPKLASGCGRIRIVEGAGEMVFDAVSHDPLSLSDGTQAGKCRGHWGEAIVACADESLCSLNQGDANVCQP